MNDTTSPDAPAEEAQGSNANTPGLLALQILEKLLIEAIKTRQNVSGAEVDLRAARDIRQRLMANPTDPAAISWVRQIAQRWSYQLKNRSLRFRHLFDHLDLAR